MDVMTKWEKAGRAVWQVQKMTSHDWKAAFKTRKRQHLSHITI